MTDKKIITIALAGNPNSGKTTIFNNITGARQKVGNWPGVTVEKKEGLINKFGYELKIVDLPGTYSLTPFSIEEVVARDFVLEESPDVVIDIIDSSNLERSLYLAMQFREIDSKVLFALNMADVIRLQETKIDAQKLSTLLDVPVVFTVGNKNEGIDNLLKEAIKLAESGSAEKEKRNIKYNKDIENAISKIQKLIEEKVKNKINYKSRWTAIKLLEDDKIVKERFAQKAGAAGEEIIEETMALRTYLSNHFNEDPEIIMTDDRYGFISGIIKEVQTTSPKRRVDISRNIDLVLTNKFIGFPIFIFFIWAMFQLTFSLGAYPMDWIESGVTLLSSGLERVVPESIFKDLLINGIIAGLGSVIVFFPNILILFFCIALFEDTGYMARTAFLMDKVMHLIGLHGKSFIPMLMGFGCNVPAIMATRTLESEKDRILTILITPFMSCSARLPIYIVLAGTFFAERAGNVIFSLYLLGILLSIISGKLFRSTLLKGADAPFVMELPPYRVPMLKSLTIHMWDRSKLFLKRMGGVILAGSIIVWFLSAFPRNIDYSEDYFYKINLVNESFNTKIALADEKDKYMLTEQRLAGVAEIQKAMNAEKVEKSYMGKIGKGLSPIFEPLGIDWRGSISLLTGFFAKEIVVSTLGVLYSTKGPDNKDALKNALRSSGMTPLSALSIMVFVLLYLPCLATIAMIKKETASFKWTAFSIIYSTSIAWIAAFCVYQGGRILGF